MARLLLGGVNDYGDTLIDTKLGKPDSTWYHVKGENYWVPSAYIDGGVGRSVFPSSLLPSNPSTGVTTPASTVQNPPGTLGFALPRTGGSSDYNVGVQSTYTDPKEYTGLVWSRIQAEVANEGKKHLVTINWGSYKWQEIIAIPRSGVVLEYQKRFQDFYSRTITVQAIDVMDGVSNITNSTIIMQGTDSPGPYLNIVDINSNWVQDSSIPMPHLSTPQVPYSHTTSSSGLKFIADHEGVELNLYNDAASHATIGIGHLVHYGPINGNESADFRDGITKQEAYDLLQMDIRRFENAVNKLVKVLLTQNQFDALVSFTFNLGEDSLKMSDLLVELNNGHYDRVPEELMRWVFTGSTRLPGLVKRREDEGKLFKS